MHAVETEQGLNQLLLSRGAKIVERSGGQPAAPAVAPEAPVSVPPLAEVTLSKEDVTGIVEAAIKPFLDKRDTRPRKWIFDVERDSKGRMERIIATVADEGK